MKRILLLILILLFLWHNAATSKGRNLDSKLLWEIDSTILHPYFNALKNGDIEAIKSYLSEKKSEESGLLELEGEEYKEHSELLKKFYEGTVFSVQRGSITEGQIIIDVEISFPGGRQKLTQFYLQEQIGDTRKTAEEKRWKIDAEQKYLNR